MSGRGSRSRLEASWRSGRPPSPETRDVIGHARASAAALYFRHRNNNEYAHSLAILYTNGFATLKKSKIMRGTLFIRGQRYAASLLYSDRA